LCPNLLRYNNVRLAIIHHPDRVKAQVQANDEASPSAEKEPSEDVSPTPSPEPEPAWMETDDQTTPASTVRPDTIEESPPPPTTGDSERYQYINADVIVFVEPDGLFDFDCFRFVVEFGCSDGTTFG
jgi:hypothetical protein